MVKKLWKVTQKGYRDSKVMYIKDKSKVDYFQKMNGRARIYSWSIKEIEVQ